MTIDINERTVRGALKVATGFGISCFIGGVYGHALKGCKSPAFNLTIIPVACFCAGMGIVVSNEIDKRMFEEDERR